MKRFVTLLMVAVLVLVASACGGGGDQPEKINGMGPADIPLKYVNALIQRDDKTLTDLIAADTSYLLKPENPPQHPNYKVTTYDLIQWKFDDETYYYLMEYMNPARNNILDREDFKIIKTKEGWKKDDFGDTPDFDAIVSKLNKSKKVLKELNEK
ncbi:hypothetical protein BK138_34480 [Paenibacillus rhizosphaerae]|uniref:DUF4825 domain-containing protein n=1 Tax=Paenibacillus rhizosphaerae TaxID=297318 RepID=A0A1R1DYX0_9BACL|nr:hypothetical protein [Paenibacillus rhizosphaerae]OMF44749.1 hypothetical protein BK138_34480 [Paenibacillus rhizosphaerae]